MSDAKMNNRITLRKAGVQTTVQDLGRVGWRHLGVAQCGALDAPSLMLANQLVGNPVGAAGLEIVIGVVEIEFHRDSWLAICGANFGAQLDGKPLAKAWRHRARAGQVLRLHGAQNEARAYFSVDGGIAVAPELGSRSTDLQAKFGGHEGRALRRGDQLPLGAPVHFDCILGVQQRIWTPEIRALPGPEAALFSNATRKAFWQHAWKLSPQSNRMGYRLLGQALQQESSPDLLSHAVLPGVVQVPPNGLPIVLMADAQTTGGYPRIACVIEADLWKLAQTPVGANFCFLEVDQATALAAQEKWAQELQRLDWAPACQARPVATLSKS